MPKVFFLFAYFQVKKVCLQCFEVSSTEAQKANKKPVDFKSKGKLV